MKNKVIGIATGLLSVITLGAVTWSASNVNE